MTPLALLPAFLLGLLGSSHCALMCGGVASVLCGGLVPLGRRSGSGRGAGADHRGRGGAAAPPGALVGGFGSILDRTPLAGTVAAAMRLGAGLLVMGAGLYLAGLLPRFAAIENVGAPVWRRVQPLARRLLPAKSAASALGVGALWGLLPCGLVYAALGLALASGTPSAGALTMLAFGAGTLPVLLAVGALAMRMAGLFSTRSWLRRTAGIAVLLLGTFDVLAGGAQLASPLHARACCSHHGVVPWR
jgi:sulfite exporter TauE/SafE